MFFWIGAGLLAAVTALIIVSPLFIRRKQEVDEKASDLAVYRDQLSELEADIARGVLSATEAETSRIEISRRLLAVDARRSDATTGSLSPNSKLALAGLLTAFMLGSLGLYSVIGSPTLPDQPLAERMKRIPQEEAEARFAELREPPATLGEREAELLDRLREVLAERPDDLTGHRLLADNLGSVGDFSGAWRAQDKVLAILGEGVAAEDVSRKAELMIYAAGGYVSPEVDQVLSESLQLDPSDQRARYFSAVSMAQNGRVDVAMGLWRGLLDEEGAQTPWKEFALAQMQQLSQAAGIPMPNDGLGGPTRDDIEAASEMDEADRADMIRGMVEGLSERLAAEGGTSSEWARLIRALTVLGETERAQSILEEAKATFAQDQSGLDEILEAAKEVGLE